MALSSLRLHTASGTVAPMSLRLVSALSILLLATGQALLASCNNLEVPSFTHSTERGPVIPLSVRLVFDESVRSATVEQTICADVLWKGHLGDAIVKSFSEIGRVRLTQLTIGDPSGTAQLATAPASEFTAFITLASASFTPTSRSGSDDSNYLAQFDVRLVATFQDTQGRGFPEAPMVYSSRVALWTPHIGGSNNQCATEQLDAAVRTATDHLADQLMGYLAQLRKKTQGEGTMASRDAPAASAPLSVIRPASTTAGSGHNPDRYAVIVGLSQYRTPWPGWQDGLSFDTKETTSLFADFLNVPKEQTLLLQDELATQTDIEEALTLWLPKRVKKDSIVFFYFAGHARTDSKTGDILLIPYDSAPQSSPSRLISLRFLQNRLVKLGARLAVAIIEAPVTTGAAAKNSTNRRADPNWIGDLDGPSSVGTGAIIQVSRHSSLSQSRESLLNGLTGKADLDKNGTVTVGEWLRSLRSIAITAPALPPNLAIQSIPLSRANQP